MSAVSPVDTIQRQARKQRITIGQVPVYFVLAILLLISLAPLFVVVKTAVSPSKTFFTEAEKILPSHPTLFNYKRALGMISNEEAIANGGSGADFNFLIALRNSVIFVGGAAFGQLFFSTLAAYAFARLHFPGRKVIFTLMLAALMVPGVVLFIPNFILIKDLKWLNSFQGQIAPFFLMTPFAVFFMRQFFLSIPTELEESARIDGASTFTILTSINLWNEFFWPWLIAKDSSKYPLTVALQAFRSQQPQGGIDWTGLMAATSLAIIPTVLLVIFLGRRVVESLQFSGSK
jgi:multiple sugar transport system permease protein